MDPNILKRITDFSMWIRVLCSFLFILINYFAQQLIILTGIAQHLFVMITGKKNKEITQFSTSLTTYAHQMMAYYNLLSEDKPFPFTPWPKKK